MQVAQRLYEDGLITYMRTDGVQMAPEAIAAARAAIAKRFGDRYVPEQPRYYQTKAKNAQEAHEAIRPTDLSRDARRRRAVARSRPGAALRPDLEAHDGEPDGGGRLERTTVEIAAGVGAARSTCAPPARSSASTASSRSTRKAATTTRERRGRRRPPAADGGGRPADRARHRRRAAFHRAAAALHRSDPDQEDGGARHRPASTYASTLSVLRDRGYVRLDKKQLIPEDKGRLVTAFLESFFERYVEYDFTADLEEKLDKISNGDLDWKDVLRDFWTAFSADVDETKDLRVSEVLERLNELLGPHIFPARADGGDPRQCPTCGTGQLSLKLGKFGAFIGCSNYPECRFTRQLAVNGENGGGEHRRRRQRCSASIPETGLDVTLRTGRFGPYVQLGEAGEERREAEARSDPARLGRRRRIDLDKALALLALPREVGLHPETGKPIIAGIGRYGPFVLHDGTYANLDSVEEVFSVGLNRAVTLIAEKQAGGGRRGSRAAPKALKDLGEHPDGGGKITVRDGRYGPYVNHGKVNATLPKDMDPADVTLEQALELIAARAGKARPRRRRPRTRKPRPKPARKPNRKPKPGKAPAEDEAGRGEAPPTADDAKETKRIEQRPETRPRQQQARTRKHSLPRGDPRLHRRTSRRGRQARDRPRLRHQGRRPHRPQGHAQGTRRRRRGRDAHAAGCKRPADLPTVIVLDVTGRDRDGELVADAGRMGRAGRAAAHRSSPPTRGKQVPAPGVGDRVLARLSPATTERLHRARHQAPRAEAADACSASSAWRRDGARIEPVDRKQKELILDAGRRGQGARTATSSR